MEYEYEMDVYGHPMSANPREKKKGTVVLSERPMVGEEIEVEGKWHKIKTIRHTSAGTTRHTSTGMVLILERHYLSD